MIYRWISVIMSTHLVAFSVRVVHRQCAAFVAFAVREHAWPANFSIGVLVPVRVDSSVES